MRFVRNALLLAGCAALSLHGAVASAAAAGSVDCASASGSVDTVLCGDASLAALDKKLVDVYAAAAKAAAPDQRNRLFAEQQSWLADRSRCTGAKDKVACMKDLYTCLLYTSDAADD